MAQKRYRVRPDTGEGRCAVFVEALGGHVVPRDDVTYSGDDAIVREHPWLFAEVGGLTERQAPEVAMARPGASRLGGPRR